MKKMAKTSQQQSEFRWQIPVRYTQFMILIYLTVLLVQILPVINLIVVAQYIYSVSYLMHLLMTFEQSN
jgi:hypothetical protein